MPFARYPIECTIDAVTTLRNKVIVWSCGLAVWTALACLMSVETAIWLAYRGEHIDWAGLIVFRIADWYSCGVFVPVLLYATRRWPIGRRNLGPRLALHIALSLAAATGKIVLFRPVRAALSNQDLVPLSEALARGIISESIAFLSVAAALHAIEYYARFRERGKLAAQLQARLSDAQLRALRAQLNPHFLFNTLNAVTALLHRDPDRADSMLTRLGEVLRLALRADPAHEVTLHEEMAVLEPYLSIMRVRFADRVAVECNIDPETLNAIVPSFILQPVIENAFEHGMAPLKRPGSVYIESRITGSSLILAVRDDGPGPSPREHDGVGLSNTRKRLFELYGDSSTMDVVGLPGGGTIAEMRMPLRWSAARA